MSCGIYIIANDRVTEQTIAFLKSIRLYDQDTKIVLIPYDENYQQVTQMAKDYGVEVYADLDLIKRLADNLYNIFGQGFFARPNQFRKQACWFGEFDRFLYIDTDIVVFEKIIDNLNYLDQFDFLNCDYQHRHGTADVFTPKIKEAGVFTDDELQEIFNGGFWASKKGIISEQDLYNIFKECAANPEYFDFSQKTSDQPIINYMILKLVKNRCNLVRYPEKGPGNSAKSPHFQKQGHILIDPNVNKPLQYLHWAGLKIEPGCPYWDIWKYYRYLGEDAPPDSALIPPESAQSKTVWQRAKDKLNKLLNNK